MANSAKATAALVVGAAFVAGVLAGIAGDRFYLFRTHQFFPRRPANFSQHVVRKLDQELQLTPAQRASVQRILEQHHGKVEAIGRQTRPQIRREIDAANVEIERILTPEQRSKFKKLRERHGLQRRGKR